jgi:carbamoyltransferase
MLLGVQIGITSGCAFIQEGEVLFAASEERFSNIKNDTGLPSKAIFKGMEVLGITSADIDHVALVTKRMSPIHFAISRECSFSVSDYIQEQYEYYRPRLLEGKKVKYFDVFPEKTKNTNYPDLVALIENSSEGDYPKAWNQWRIDKLSSLLNLPKDIFFIESHEHAHACYGYYGSPFRGDDVLIVTIDGFGDYSNATIWEDCDEGLRKLASYDDFNVGRIYRYITLLLGMKPNEHEYKVMGLAPYASDYVSKIPLSVFQDAYQFTEDGRIEIEPSLRENFFYFKDRLEGCRFDGIAGGLQAFTEKMICDLVSFWCRKLSKRRVVLSGGVSLNVKANMEVSSLSEVDELFVVGGGGDESLCIGAGFAYFDRKNQAEKIVSLDNLYLGQAPRPEEVRDVLARLEALDGFMVARDVGPLVIAEKLAEGLILGRVAGRMEFGARALGNRSIMADPKSLEAVKKINEKIKRRDFWMPFTPSILEDCAVEYLQNPKKLKFPYMSVACNSTEKGRRSLPAALHPYDHTVRPQIVTASSNPEYYDIIKAFYELTGVGALLNTSLNLHGFPMAGNVAEGVYVFENSDLDGLVIENNLILRS